VPTAAEPSEDRFHAVAVAVTRRAYGAGAVVAVALAVVGALALSWWVGLLVAVVVTGLWVLWVRNLLASVVHKVLAAAGAEVLDEGSAPSLHNAMDGVSVLAGVPSPSLHRRPDAAANALCAADAHGAAVVVTTGLLDGLRPTELEVVAAELLCRVRDGSARVGTLAAGLPGWLCRLCGLSPRALAAVMGDQRATRADLAAVSLTRYPPALISVLDHMAAAGTSIAGAEPASAPLWLAPAVGREQGVDPVLEATANQPLAHRIAVLREL
jgi:Zn-dependent protease with chaperone function